ncbi:MAG: alginate lyase family protein [Opitutaceae bacterium]|nr:alginate lyase family protein [Opitutaceae bacterium]
MNVKSSLLALAVLAAAVATSDARAEPRYFAARPGALAAAKARLAAGDATLQPALDKLVADADRALAFMPVCVTQKTKLAPSGDRHDYLSTAPYFWPDPSKPDGRPYVRRDGKINPESRTAASDQLRLEGLGRTVETLALAYWFTGREAYAAHAARCLRVWFLDSATRMNPHFNYSQGVPGLSEGRPAGMIEAGGLIDAADASGLLAGSAAWPESEEIALREWCAAFLDWMRTSKLGRAVSAADNNQATMSDVRAVRFAFKVGRTDLAREILTAVGPQRIAVQIAPDGRQPHELTRTKSFSYSRLNLSGLGTLATLAERVGVDLWNFATPDGRSLRKAIDYLAPYAKSSPPPWPHEQIAELDGASLAPIFRQAARAYRDAGYAQIAAQLPVTERARSQLLDPTTTR